MPVPRAATARLNTRTRKPCALTTHCRNVWLADLSAALDPDVSSTSIRADNTCARSSPLAAPATTRGFSATADRAITWRWHARALATLWPREMSSTTAAARTGKPQQHRGCRAKGGAEGSAPGMSSAAGPASSPSGISDITTCAYPTVCGTVRVLAYTTHLAQTLSRGRRAVARELV